MSNLSEDIIKDRDKNYNTLLRNRETLLTPLLGKPIIWAGIPSRKLINWISTWCKCLKPHAIIEVYVLFFLVLEFILFLVIGKMNPGYVSLWLGVPVTVVLCLRLIDIFQSWYSIFVDWPSPEIFSSTRSLILAIINYVEIILVFSILGYAWNVNLEPPITNMADSASFTIGTMTAIGSNTTPVSIWAWIIYLAEIGFGLFFLIVVVARILSNIDSKKGYKK